MTAGLAGPPTDCRRCPRLCGLRDRLRTEQPDWHNAPVPSFGGADAELLIVGLAPGLQGANRTGRPFTGDGAGEVLYPALLKFGFATGVYDARPDDGLALAKARITNAVRCVPPENKPVGAEVTACNPFLTNEIAALPKLRTVLALGHVAHGAVLRALGVKGIPFKHGAIADAGRYRLADSYHCSRYNMNTGRLTVAMFDAVIEGIAAGA